MPSDHTRRLSELLAIETKHARTAPAHLVDGANEYQERRLEHAFRFAVQDGYELGAAHAREVAREAEAQLLTVAYRAEQGLRKDGWRDE